MAAVAQVKRLVISGWGEGGGCSSPAFAQTVSLASLVMIQLCVNAFKGELS